VEISPNLGAVGDKDKLIKFWGQRTRSRPDQIHIWSKRHCGNLKVTSSNVTVTDSLFMQRH